MTDTQKMMVKETGERLGWTVHFYTQTVRKFMADSFSSGGTMEEQYASFYKFSPAGEDFGFDVFYEDTLDSLIDGVKEYAATFDVDEHVELWIDSRGKNGVPSSIKELVYDAEAIDRMCQELAMALSELEEV